MAKQTFTTGQVLTAAQMTSLQQTAMLGGAASAKVASYVLVAADAGDAITMSNAGATTITVDTGLFATGDIVTIINIGAGACTITAGTATVTTSGSLVLAQNQGGVLRFTSPSAAIFLQFATPASGDIEGVTAGTGLSGGGTSGTVTVTNSMATAIDAKGDLVPGTGADTFARLAVGANNTVLTADSTTATGLKWATPSSGGMTLISTTTLSGSSTTLSSIPGTYTNLFLYIKDFLPSSVGKFRIYFNGSFNNNDYSYVVQTTTANSGSSATPSFTYYSRAGYIEPAADSSIDYAQQIILNLYYYVGAGQPAPLFDIIHGGSINGLNQQVGRIYGSEMAATTVTSITIACSAGTFSAGTAYLYGVK